MTWTKLNDFYYELPLGNAVYEIYFWDGTWKYRVVKLDWYTEENDFEFETANEAMNACEEHYYLR